MNNKEAAQGAGASKQVDELATISVEALFQRLGTTKAGLSEEEAERRLDQYGPNEVAAEKEHTWVHRLFTASRNPLVILLTVLATISYATGDLRAGTRDALDGDSWIGLALRSGKSRGRRGGEIESNDQRHGDGGPQRRGQGDSRSASLSPVTSSSCQLAT